MNRWRNPVIFMSRETTRALWEQVYGTVLSDVDLLANLSWGVSDMPIRYDDALPFGAARVEEDPATTVDDYPDPVERARSRADATTDATTDRPPRTELRKAERDGQPAEHLTECALRLYPGDATARCTCRDWSPE